ncbi:hypothetical protein ACCO45_003105 [Purpureocillium lilacinum]|uniref:Uncharacterized protein n=1 Tax=Purpureocillium lilacinum TaxID=33203 RepID=A0ACC4DYY5_PURLI
MGEDAAGDGHVNESQRRDGKRVARDTEETQGEGHDHHPEVSAPDRTLGERLTASGKMALHAMSSGDGGMPSTMSDQKSAAAPGLGGSAATHLSQTMAEASSASSSQRAAQPDHGASFRTHSHSEDAADAFDSFMGGPNNGPRLPAAGQQLHGSVPSSGQPTATSGQQRTVAQQEAVDGADVVHLLSVPDHEGDATAWTAGEDDDALSPAEEARLHAVADPADMLELLGTAETSAADSIWLQHWSDVLSAYNDEVWGDLGPLAAEAKHEVDRLSSRDAQGQGQGETTALNRLRQILAHVRGPA